MGDSFSSMKKGGAPIAPAFPKRKQHSSKQYYNKNGGPDLPIRPNRSVADNEPSADTRGIEGRYPSCILFCKLCQSNKHEIHRSGPFAAGHSCASLGFTPKSSSTYK